MEEIKDTLAQIIYSYKKNSRKLELQFDLHMLLSVIVSISTIVYWYLGGEKSTRIFSMTLLYSISTFFISLCTKLCLYENNPYRKVSRKRLYLEFMICHVLLFLAVFNFLQ